MKALVYDTETTGLFNYSQPADADGQPRMCQLSAWLIGRKGVDEGGEEHPDFPGLLVYGRYDQFIKPDGWEYPVELGVKLGHGRNTAFYEANGVPVREALDVFAMLHDAADIVMAFNVDYDLKVTRAELRRAGLADRYGEKPKFCLMRKSGKICDLRNVKNGFKNPTLAEAHQILVGKPHTDAHDATADNLANIGIYLELMRRGVEIDMTLPESKLKAAAPPAAPALTGATISGEPESFLN